MATSKSSTSNEPEVQAEDAPPEDPPPDEAQPVAAQMTVEEEAPRYVLPPTLVEAGLSGVIGVTAGQYSTPSGSFFALSPGQVYTVSGDDAAALIEMGVAVALEDVSPTG
jgi:hypothetical protein